MKKGTIVIPHAFTCRWSQICIASLKAHKNVEDVDIIIVDNSYPHPSIRGITETSLEEGVNKVMVFPQTDNDLRGHQLALDFALPFVNTEWFIAWETDVQVMRDGWLDWMLSHVRDEYVALVGWYWQEENIDDSRHYISPAGALYRTRICKWLAEECKRNTDLKCCLGPKMDQRIDFATEYAHTAGKLIPAGKWGCFVESRGFGNVYPYADQRPFWCPEPGHWIYNRMKLQWEVVHAPGGWVKNENCTHGIPYAHSYIGNSPDEAYLIHRFAGTVSHNFDKHLIPPHDVPKLEWWLSREHSLWDQVVPEDVRKRTIELGLVRTYDEEMNYALSRVAR